MRHDNLAYSDEGRGLPVCFIHAFPLNRRMWLPQAALREQVRVLAVDLRGHGESGPIPDSWTIDGFASDLRTLLDHLSISEAVLVGSSMGGYVALAFARLYAHRIKGLVLADTRAQSDSAEGRAGRFAMIRTAETEGNRAIADLMLSKLLSLRSLQSNPELVQHLRSMIENTPAASIRSDLRAMADRLDSTKLIGTMTWPTLVMVGELDTATPLSDAQYIAQRARNARLQVISGAGHLPNLEQPDAFNDTLMSFLKSIS